MATPPMQSSVITHSPTHQVPAYQLLWVRAPRTGSAALGIPKERVDGEFFFSLPRDARMDLVRLLPPPPFFCPGSGMLRLVCRSGRSVIFEEGVFFFSGRNKARRLSHPVVVIDTTPTNDCTKPPLRTRASTPPPTPQHYPLPTPT